MPIKVNYLRYSEYAFLCITNVFKTWACANNDDLSRLQDLNQSFFTHLIRRK